MSGESHRIGRADDVPMLEGRSVTVGARRIAIFRTARRLGRDRRTPARTRAARSPTASSPTAA